ncbi:MULTISPECIES: WcaI family glycosyltransferase [Algibacter]|uniref:Colanic acid biosynthesis glycosyl transferase WcaI n=2 Tax=Algibacter TaxID=261827 RepID=A0A4R8MA01_9FLAO|nr:MULTISPECIES: WcaI family glycosyltransferase [Algibacter]MDN3664912.1 WcaI family glycosyltransferase [Algibacter miyuki]TDY62453.1 colanic acid biosynthesis glycosyl transferase WcaI [Algibacter lectus]
MSKRITIIGINYYPEDSAIGLYTTQKAEYLVSKGLDVTVITGFPYYPQWEIREDYKSKGYFVNETINGVKVYRSKQYVPKDPTFIKRIRHLISFTFGNFLNLFKTNKPDVVISIIPFTTSALLGWFLKIRYKCKHWVHIQDFEFDAAIDSGLLKGNKKSVIKFLQSIEGFVLKKADIVSTISHGMIKKLKAKTDTKTYYLTNWIDVSKFSSTTLETHPYLTSNKFKILYSGNIGAKQDWDFFVNVLKKLEKLSDVEVILVGEGAEKENVLEKIKDFNFVKHFNLVPYAELASLLSSADVHILFQKTDVIDTVMPSKILGMMASAKPSIVTGNIKSEVAMVFEDSHGGFYFDGESTNQVIDQIKILKEDKALCTKLGKGAKLYVEEKFSKDKVLNDFIEKL